jgi:predicted O-linked N-acetylglucosamine transferase (SPINDLY family)
MEWRPVVGFSHEELAEQIRRDEVDILVDLIGHVGKRLMVFARRPAPLQVTWLGYVGTTGLTAMDFLLADRYHVPSGEEGNYVEQILRMPNGYACYGPPTEAPAVGPLPALAVGHVTLGCFNNPAKFSPSTLDVWAEILRGVPGSRLLLRYGGLDQPHLQARLRGQFAERGVMPERILLEGWSPHRELLNGYNRVDLALDTQPYSGGLTTCEALWMGVPVVTFPGETFAGRHSVSYLTNAGYPQFIATDAAEFVRLAVGWANRLDELASLRAEMRPRVSRSPLCDGPAFARDFLSVLSAAWKSRQQNKPLRRA